MNKYEKRKNIERGILGTSVAILLIFETIIRVLGPIFEVVFLLTFILQYTLGQYSTGHLQNRPTLGFVAPSLDTASQALAETVIKRGELRKIIRLFWCVEWTWVC